MGYASIQGVFEQAGLATRAQFTEWRKAWRVATESGSQENLLEFICRERGLSDEQFLQQLASALNWPFVDLPRTSVDAEVQKRISTKVAFQYFVLPFRQEDGVLHVAVSNPFDTALLNAVQFDAQCPVQLALAPKHEIEKALKKYYGVGAETLDEMAEEEPGGIAGGRRQGDYRGRSGSERHQIR